MNNRNLIQALIDNQTVEAVLRRKSPEKDSIRALQTTLYNLGFGGELNWNTYGADGDYGGSTTRAVKAFAEKNGINTDGKVVSTQLAQKIVSRFDLLDEMRYMKNAVAGGKTEERMYRGSSDFTAVSVVQQLLNGIGLGDGLENETHGAKSQFGPKTSKALKELATQEKIDYDGVKLSQDLGSKIMKRVEEFLGTDWFQENHIEPETSPTSDKLTFREVTEKDRPRLYVSDTTHEVRFTKYKRGCYYFGTQKPMDFITHRRSDLASCGLTDSAVNVMIAVAENEGNLDAINTWDDSFLTFGMFQWTVGAASSKGELPALLKKIKAADPDVFETYYGQHGLDVADSDSIYGRFTLRGALLDSAQAKEALRDASWAFYFWKSGQHPLVQRVQIQHALSRLDTFYHAESYKVGDYYISDLVTSEYGVGLVLDNHVNRPGYIKACLKKALEQTGLTAPETWGTAEERRLMDAYCQIRISYGKYPMTDAAKRAGVTQKYLQRRLISDERGSFHYVRK